VSALNLVRCEQYGLRDVERDADTAGGWVGSVATQEIAERVVEEARAEGLRATWVEDGVEDENDGCSSRLPRRWWVYLAPEDKSE